MSAVEGPSKGLQTRLRNRVASGFEAASAARTSVRPGRSPTPLLRSITLALVFVVVAGVPEPGRSQVPHRLLELLGVLDLSGRDPELSARIIWEQADLIPGCRQNFQPDAACDQTVHQFVKGPVLRATEIPPVDVGFLPNRFVNKLESATIVSEHSKLHEFCTGDSVEALSAVRTAEDREPGDTLHVTYLSQDDPWFYCFHFENFEAARARSSSQAFRLTRDVFWIWSAGGVVGNAVCGVPGSAPNPQCGVDLFFDGGSVVMTIGPFPAVNLRRVLRNLGSMTHRFRDGTDIDTAFWGIDETLFDLPLSLDKRAQLKLGAIERALR